MPSVLGTNADRFSLKLYLCFIAVKSKNNELVGDELRSGLEPESSHKKLQPSQTISSRLQSGQEVPTTLTSC